MMLWKWCTSIYQQVWKTQQWPQDWKRLVFIPIPKKGNATECSNYHTIALFSHISKVMLKILQARLQKVCELWSSRYSSWFYKRQRKQKSNCQHPLDHQKSKRSRKTYISALLTMPKPLTVWITTNCRKFWKRWEYRPPDLPFK